MIIKSQQQTILWRWGSLTLGVGLALISACSQNKASQQANAPPPTPASQQAKTKDAMPSLDEIRIRSMRCGEELLTLTALETELQADCMKKKTQYESLEANPKSTAEQRDDAKRDFLECQDSLVTLKEQLLEKRNEQRDLDDKRAYLERAEQKKARRK